MLQQNSRSQVEHSTSQLPEFVVTPVSPIGLSEWIVIVVVNGLMLWSQEMCVVKRLDLKSVQGNVLKNVTRIKKSSGVI